MRERRRYPRIQCRLQCRIRQGRQRIQARVLDVSEGGLCLLTPVQLKKGESLHIEIDVPGRGPAPIEADVWHVRRTRNASTRRRAWTVGMLLVKADHAYAQLLGNDGEVALETETETEPGPELPVEEDLSIDIETDDGQKLQVFQVRVQAKGGPRTRLVTLCAASEAEAGELAAAELEGQWIVTEVKPAS